MVAGKRCRMSCMTGCEVRIEVPKSPTVMRST